MSLLLAPLFAFALASGQATVPQPSPAAATPRAPSRYLVAMEVRRGTEVLGTPSVTLNEGGDARVEVAGRYALQVRANRLAATTGPVRVLIDAQLFLAEAQGWRHFGGAEVLAPLDTRQTAPIRVPGDATADNGSVALTVTAAPAG